MQSNVVLFKLEVRYLLSLHLKQINQSIYHESDILKVIRNLSSNKAHGHDEISIRMLQICDKTACKPLYLIFPSCMESDMFPSQLKMANVVPA